MCVLPLKSGLLTRGYTIRENSLSLQQLTTALELGMGLCAQLAMLGFWSGVVVGVAGSPAPS